MMRDRDRFVWETGRGLFAGFTELENQFVMTLVKRSCLVASAVLPLKFDDTN